MLRVEVLYPEVCNLFGNTYNIKYLEQSVEDIEIINTSLNDEPTFVKEDIDLVYMAPMTEKTQELVIEKLKPYTETIKKQIQENKAFFMIGNALEVFVKYIENVANVVDKTSIGTGESFYVDVNKNVNR